MNAWETAFAMIELASKSPWRKLPPPPPGVFELRPPPPVPTGKCRRMVEIDYKNVYEVEKVLQVEYNAYGKAHRFLVSWTGYPPSDNSWVETKDLMASPEDFCKQHGLAVSQ